MLSDIELTVASESSILAEIILALHKKGYKVFRQSQSNLKDKNHSLIKITIESSYAVTKNELEDLKTSIPQILQINNKATAIITETPTEIDVSEKLKIYGKQLIAQYPKIRQPLQKFDKELDTTARQEVMTKLGKGFGRWQYQNNYTLGGLLPLDKTLQRMV